MVRNALTSSTLIDRYIDPNPWGGAGRHRAHLKKYGVSVWALANRLNTGTSIPDLAREYRLPEEAVEAAKAFYEQNRAIIDAWILINESEVEE
jgi:uncharacterized protein (DUF433 family)